VDVSYTRVAVIGVAGYPENGVIVNKITFGSASSGT
jgi:hypothetical protein